MIKNTEKKFTIFCPYCARKHYYNIKNIENGKKNEVVCYWCKRTFLAEMKVEVSVEDVRGCECLDDKTLCEVKEEVITKEFLGLGTLSRRFCKNCGRNMVKEGL